MSMSLKNTIIILFISFHTFFLCVLIVHKNFFLTEELLKSQKAIWSSNDGLLLLYASFNDTNVGQMVYPWFSSNKLVLQAGKITKNG